MKAVDLNVKLKPRKCRLAKRLSILCLLLMPIGCGFHLRGTSEQYVPLPPIQLTYSALPKEWSKSLETFLISNHVVISDTGQYHLIVNHLGESRRVASLNARAKAAEYEIEFDLSYQVLDRNGNALSEQKTIRASRTYQFIQSQVVGKEREEQMLKTQIQKSLFQKLLRHLQQLNRRSHAT